MAAPLSRTSAATPLQGLACSYAGTSSSLLHLLQPARRALPILRRHRQRSPFSSTSSSSAHIKHAALEPIRDPPRSPDPNHISNMDWTKVKHSDLAPGDHSLYWGDCAAPTPRQLAWANAFFASTASHTSKRLQPARAYHQLERPRPGLPELVFMSASNGEKRLTLNWVFEQYLSVASAAPGRKYKLIPYAIGWRELRDYKAVIVDTPGLASKNSDERAQMFARYLISKGRR